MLQFINLTGKKESKSFNEEVVIATSTLGDFKLTPLVQTKLEVKDGDTIVTVIHPEDNKRVFIAKGITGTPVQDENGIVKDERGRTIYVEGSDFGAVVRTASPGSRLLKLTATVAWNAIGANTEMVKEYTLSEGQEGQVPTGRKDSNGNDELHTAVFYELIFKGETPKAARKKKEDVVDGAGNAVASPEFEEEEEEEQYENEV